MLRNHYFLSPAQKRLWVLSQFEGGNSAYNISGVYVFEGYVDYSALKYAFNVLIRRHEILRTTFKEDEEGEIVQFVTPAELAKTELRYEDLSKNKISKEQLDDLIRAEIVKPFDLLTGPLIGVSLYKIASGKWLFVYVLHHIITDGWSMEVLMRDLLKAYHSRVLGEDSPLPGLRIQYKDYAAWQNTRLSGEALKADRAYWLKKLGGELPVLQLAADKSRPALKTYNGHVIARTISLPLSNSVKALCQANGSTLFMGLFAAVNTLLYRYTSQQDQVIGTPVSGREHPDLEDQIGLYINTLAIRTAITGGMSFLEVLQQVKSTTLEAYKYQSYPFDTLVEELGITHDPARNPLFDVMVVLQNQHVSTLKELSDQQEVTISEYPGPGQQTAKFDILFNFIDTAQGISSRVEYNSDIYSEAQMSRLAEHLQQVLEAAISNTAVPIKDLDYLSSKEKQDLQSLFDRTAVGYPAEQTILDLFEQQAAASPHSIAVSHESEQITYQELNARANQLGRYLRSRYPVKKESLAGIQLGRSVEMIVSILGILKSGGAYVPIDPDYPEERIGYITKDSACTLTIDAQEYARFDRERNNYDPSNLPQVNTANDLAYVIYTSGSTGQPKGVMITHRNVVRLFKNDAPQFVFTPEDVWTMFHSYCFDFSVWEMYGALFFGGRLVIVPSNVAKDSSQFSALLIKEGVTILNQTPSAFYALQEHLQEQAAMLKIRYLVFGGEALNPSKLKLWQSAVEGRRVVNMYGITETTVHVSYQEIQSHHLSQGTSVIGKPLPTLSALILDAEGHLVPKGIVGELYIGGAGVARGYLNRPGLTAARFVADRFSQEAGARLYRSGDLARVLADDTIEYTGRIDDQVKIRGHRIELGEIMHALDQDPAVESSAVIARPGSDGQQELIAYIVSKEALNASALRSYLGERLPHYMLPSYYVQLDALPLTVNGKLDKKNLPDPQGLALETGVAYVAPVTEVQQKLCDIYSHILKVEKETIGIHNSFFALGGDSIKAMKLVSRINQQLGIKISVINLYKNPTIETLSELLSGSGSEDPVYDALKAGLQQIGSIQKLIREENELINKLPENYEDIYPLTPVELGMIYSSMRRIDEPVYYDQFRFFVEIDDLAAFKNAIEVLIQRHPVFRTKYYVQSFSQPVKAVLKQIKNPIVYENLSALFDDEKETHINAFLKADQKLRLSFDDELFWHIRLFKLSAKKYSIVWSFHHSAFDGWSISVFNAEITRLLSDNKQVQLSELKYSYKDYCAILLGRTKQEGIESYWKSLFDGYTRNKLPFNYKGLKISDEKGMKRVSTKIDDALRLKLNGLAVQHQVSFKAICLAAHVYMLHVVCSERDIVTGTVTHDRPEIDGAENILGCFLNTIPIRVNLEELPDILSLLTHVSGYLTGVKKNEIHLSEIATILDERNVFGNPIFDTLFNFTDFHSYEDADKSASLKAFNYERNTPEVEDSTEMTNTLFDVEVDKTLDVFSVSVKFTPAYFNAADVKRAIDLYVSILEFFAKDVSAPLFSLNLLDQAQFDDVVVNFNATELPYADKKTIHQLFEEQVIRSPHHAAIKQHGVSMSYSELNVLSNQLARLLISMGSQPGDNIGLLTARGFNMIVGMLGILKAGCAYVPVDPDYPVERQKYIILNSNVTKVISDVESPLSGVLIDIPFIPVQRDKLSGYNDQNLNLAPDSKQLAYTIYTSGSTGNPKGVMIEHHSVVNLIEWVNKAFSIGQEDKLLFITSMCFDLSVYDIFGMLSAGGTIVIAKQNEVQDLALLKDLLVTEKITFWDSVPTTLSYLVNELEAGNESYLQNDLRLIFLSGDWIPTQLPGKIKRYFPNASTISLGGATEGTVWSNYFPVSQVDKAWSSIPYGKPISNNTFYILNDNLLPVPKGVAGELYIGGVGVARGYANEPEKTACSFIADPFNKRLGGRMYRTGDLGRLMPDGNMEFLGRKDNQVKIRGYRVELGEIESVLLRNSKIKECVVIASKDSGNNTHVCAYLVLGGELEKAELKEYLKERIASYMVPDYYVFMDALPLTSNGKINRKALPAVTEEDVLSIEYVAPVTDLEISIGRVWKAILNQDKFGVKDNFFELGANSLSVGAFVNRFHRETGLLVTIQDVFANPTIEGIAGVLQHTQKQAYVSISPVALASSYPLSSSQRRLWVLSHFAAGNIAYNISNVYLFKGRLDVEGLTYAFDSLLARHESLRTVFRENEAGEVRQQVQTPRESGFRIGVEDLRDTPGLEARLHALVQQEFATPFDLKKGPLLRATLYQVSQDSWVFSYTLHHIISDGLSMEILIRELLLFYDSHIQGSSPSLAPLRIQYKDYAVWQQQELSKGVLAAAASYWQNQLSGELPVLELPADRVRPALVTYNGRTLTRRMPQALSKGLRELSRSEDVTLFMSLLGLVNTLLYKYSGQQDIIVGSPISGRSHADLEDQMGFYVNTLALRTRFDDSASFKALLQSIKQVTLDAYDHQSYPFDDLVEALDLPRDMSRNTLFDVMVSIQTAQTSSRADKEKSEAARALTVSGYEGAENRVSKFDLTFDFIDLGEELDVHIEYNTDLYNQSTIERLYGHLEELLSAIVSNPSQHLSTLNYLSKAEEQQILVSFNATETPYPKDKTFIDLFEAQAGKTPNDTALICNERTYTYKALNEKANQLGGYLRRHYQVKADDLLGIKLVRDEWMLISILGILKAGGAYVPIDNEYPQERINYIKQDSHCKVILDRAELDRFEQEASVYDYPKTNIEPIIQPNNLAYVIYTSGSTGKPKGALIEHAGMLNHLLAMQAELQLNAQSRIAQNAAYTFDISVWQLLNALIVGGTTVIYDNATILDPASYINRLKSDKISILQVVPSYLTAILDAISADTTNDHNFSQLSYLLVTGETISQPVLKRWFDLYPGTRVVNAYGPAEAADDVTLHIMRALPEGTNIPIGKPIQNINIYIVNKQGGLCPVGQTGEIYVSGIGVGRGYINDPEKTSKSFGYDVFKNDPQVRMYRTGDLGKWKPDGTLEFTGRKDEQIKLRGYRIELGEIESAILKHPLITEAAVILNEGAGREKALIAYYASGEQVTAADLRQLLGAALPNYMVPAYFVELAQLPRNANGKINRKALPQSNLAVTSHPYMKPQTDIQVALVKIWQDVLSKEKIGITDNFFELGGHSLKLISVVSKVHQQFDVKIDLNFFFQTPYIQNISQYIEAVLSLQHSTVSGEDDLIF